MKDDYLWDKTGEDAGIEGLENALKAFRYQESEPPALPQKVFTVEKTNGRRFFQFRFALAAFAAVVVVLSLVWLKFADNKMPPAGSVALIEVPLEKVKINDEDFISKPDAPGKAVLSPQPQEKPNAVRIRQKSAPIIRAEKTVLRKLEPKSPAETLTAEEKYAYDQLMLALSITSSKLKIVKDKVQGIEEKRAVLETAK